MTAPLYAIGRFCSRHHYPTIAAWLVVAVVLVIAGQASGDKTNDNLTLPGTGSTLATELLEDNLPEQAYGSNPLAFESKSGPLTQSRYARAIEESIKRLDAMPDVNSAISPLSKEGSEAGLLSKDMTIAYTPVILGVGPGELTEEQAEDVLNAAEPARRAGLETSVGSYVGQQLSKPDTGVSDAIGIAAAIVILLFAFGTATAMVMPIGSAIVGLAVSLSIIRLLENAVEVPSVASTLATMIGLGVGIDYALFIVTRHKLQLAEGMELRESIARATATAGGAVALCRLHGGDRALLARLRRDPAGQHARIHGGDRRRRRRLRGGDPAAGDARRARPPHRLAAGAGDRRRAGRQRAARLASLGAGRRRPSLALGACRPHDPPRAGPADLPARTRSERPQRLAEVDDRAPELRLADEGLRAGGERSAADRVRIRQPRGSEESVADPGEAGLDGARRRRGFRTDSRQGGHRRGLHGDLELGPLGRGDRQSGRRSARNDDPARRCAAAGQPPTSAGRPPATSTWRPRSPTSCR